MIGATAGVGLFTQGTSQIILECTDIWGNAGGDWDGPIADQLGQDGNICVDPRFCDPENLDFTLAGDSPCVPGAIPGCGVVGAWPVGCNHPLDVWPGSVVPAGLLLAPNAPNPFNPSTTIVFAVPATGPVLLQVFDLRGQLVRTLVDDSLAAGRHEAQWDGRSDAGRELPSAVYVSRLRSGGLAARGRMMLVR